MIIILIIKHYIYKLNDLIFSLKLSNILCKNGVTKIADLGIAKKVTSNNT